MLLFTKKELEVFGCEECVIYMLKPDAIHQRLQSKISDRVNELCNIRTIYTVQTRLTKEMVIDLFLHTQEEYISYLLSGPVILRLVRGANAIENLYWAKRQIRKEFGVDGKMKNLIHATDPGNEYWGLLNTFFSKYAGRAAGLCDYQVAIASLEDLKVHINKLKNLDFPKYVVFNLSKLDSDQIDTALYYFRICPVSFAFRFSVTVQLANISIDICFSRRKEWESIRMHGIKSGLPAFVSNAMLERGIVGMYLSILEGNRQTEQFLKALPIYNILREYKILFPNIFGMMCFCPGFELAETEFRMELAELLGLIAVGGSCCPNYFGKFTASISSEMEGHETR